MHSEQHIKLFIAILSAHKGVRQAISVPDMAGRLGFERDKTGQRKAQMVKAAVVEQGYLVGSSCSNKTSGWYTPANEAEIQLTLNQYKARIRSLALTIRQTEGAAGFKKFVGQLAMEFEKEVSV